MGLAKGLACALAASPLCACTTIIVGENATQDIVSVGVTRIIVPERQGDLIAVKRTGFGVGYGDAVGSAAFLGFDQSEWVLADPSQCQMLIVIRSNADADHAAKILEKLEGEDICFANDTPR